jgi:hypothetical protein
MSDSKAKAGVKKLVTDGRMALFVYLKGSLPYPEIVVVDLSVIKSRQSGVICEDGCVKLRPS